MDHACLIHGIDLLSSWHILMLILRTGLVGESGPRWMLRMLTRLGIRRRSSGSRLHSRLLVSMISMILMLLRMLKGVGHDGDLVLTNTWGAESRKWRLLNPNYLFTCHFLHPEKYKICYFIRTVFIDQDSLQLPSFCCLGS